MTLRRLVASKIILYALATPMIAAFVTTVELAMNAWLHELYTILGIFIPLIVTNCAIIGRAEAFASRNTVVHAALDGNDMVTIHDYVGQDHAFARVGGKHYDQSSADLARGRTLDHFKAHLG